MPPSYKASLVLATLATLGLVAAPAARAATLSGSYNNSPRLPASYNGYDATAAGNPYTIAPTATFDNNHDNGFSSFDVGISLVIDGGTFDDNGGNGLIVGSQNLGGVIFSGSSVVINGGTFDGNAVAGFSPGYGAFATINGGSFDNNNDGVFADGTTVTIFGGTFAGNAHADLTGFSGGIFTLYGAFGALTGKTLTGSGTFMGTLQDDSTPQTFTYNVQTFGKVVLDAAAIPEPSPFVLLGLGFLPLGLLARKRRA